MQLQPFENSDVGRLYDYFMEVGKNTPFFFAVTRERWTKCLLSDALHGESILRESHIWLAIEENTILGFIQYGKPNLSFTAEGEKIINPEIGLIRQLYFSKGRVDVGEALISQAETYLAAYSDCHAFFHILGMSCNAYHGKLPSNMSEVEGVLLRRGFIKEHENVYYILSLVDFNDTILCREGFKVSRQDCSISKDTESFTATDKGQEIGWAQIRYLTELTGGATTATAYLTWIKINKIHQGLGLGRSLLGHIISYLKGRGFRQLHTDTADTNLIAQHFYESFGFSRHETTRSYVRVS